METNSIPENLIPDEGSRQVDGQLNIGQSDLAAVPSIEPALDHLERHRAFPLDVFPPKVRKFICEVAASRQCPLDFVALAVLAVAATAIGAARVIRLTNDWDESTGIYGALVGSPGSSKTPALTAVIKPLQAIQKRRVSEYQQAKRQFDELLRTYRAARHRRSESSSAATPVAPAPPSPMQHLLTTDSTIEALAVNLQGSPKGMLLLQDELQRFLRKMKGNGQNQARERTVYLEFWSNSMVKVDRKSAPNEPIFLDRPLVGILGGIQPDLLRTLLLQNTEDDGLIGRFLFVWPDRQPFPGCTDARLSEQSKADWNDIVNKLYNLNFDVTAPESNQPIKLHLDDNAIKVHKEFQEMLQADVESQKIPPVLEATCKKIRSYFGRFALVLRLLWAAEKDSHAQTPAAIKKKNFMNTLNMTRYIMPEIVPLSARETDKPEGVRIVHGEDVSRAAQLCWYFLGQAELVVHAGETQRDDKQIDRLVAWLKRNRRKSCTARDVANAELSGVKSTEDARTLLSRAVAQDVGSWREPTGKRRSQEFVLR